jgi:protein TonB
MSLPAGSPLPPPLPRRFPALDRLRNLFAWGVAVSVAVHLAFGPLLGFYKPSHAEQGETEKVSVSNKIKVVVPTPPPPTPTPPPVKPSVQVAPKQQAAPKKEALKLNVVHTTSNSKSANGDGAAYAAPAEGGENGAPGGTAASAPPAAPSAAPATAAPPPPTPTPTPRPACAVPNLEARMVRQEEPDYPESAKMNGVVGSVDVRVTLSPSGAVLHAAVYKSSGNAALDNSAVLAAQASTYAPEVAECKPVGGNYLFHADFTN